jgi:hypothetical protein
VVEFGEGEQDTSPDEPVAAAEGQFQGGVQCTFRAHEVAEHAASVAQPGEGIGLADDVAGVLHPLEHGAEGIGGLGGVVAAEVRSASSQRVWAVSRTEPSFWQMARALSSRCSAAS